MPPKEKQEGKEQNIETKKQSRAKFRCKVKYNNELPPLPFDLKYITYPFDDNRFYYYKPTSLERMYQFEILADTDMGLSMDLIDKSAYERSSQTSFHPIDEILLDDETEESNTSKRSRHHAKRVSWLRRTEYISTEQTRYQPQAADNIESKVGYNIKQKLKGELIYMDRNAQIQAIEKTFEDAKIPIDKHYGKQNVYPVEVLPVFPDFKLFKYGWAQVVFDSDPSPPGVKFCDAVKKMPHALIRGVKYEQGEEFVGYFLPREETLMKIQEDISNGVPYQENKQYKYDLARSYNWNLKCRGTNAFLELYFMEFRKDGVYYNEIDTRVALRRRQMNIQHKTSLSVKFLPVDFESTRAYEIREMRLKPLVYGDMGSDDDDSNKIDDLEEEEKDSEEKKIKHSKKKSKKREHIEEESENDRNIINNGYVQAYTESESKQI